jgi:hypothetical protein
MIFAVALTPSERHDIEACLGAYYDHPVFP